MNFVSQFMKNSEFAHLQAMKTIFQIHQRRLELWPILHTCSVELELYGFSDVNKRGGVRINKN